MARLKVGIIGAGIAGLSAATALSQAGHQVEVYEKSRFNNEVGAAINVCPNASRVLRHWGFEFDKRAPTFAKNSRIILPNGDIASTSSYEDSEDRYGAPFYLLHRVDLHTGLKELAAQAGAVINVRSEVVDLDCDAGRITLQGGKQIDLDVVVVADGVHSRFVRLMNEGGTQAERTGYSIYRWLAPIDELRSNPKTLPFIESSTLEGLNIRVIDPHTRIVHYPCRNGTVMNLAAIHPDHLHTHQGELVENFDASGDVEGLVRMTSSLDESVVEVCRQAKDLKLWPLVFREPLITWRRGKAILIGDAAHPMLPHQGQGGCQAIEDGAALGVILADAKAGDDIRDRLALVEDVRKWRASTIQYMSNAGQDQAEHTAEKVRKVIRGNTVPKTLHEIHDFNFGHDVLKESGDALARAAMK